MMETLVGWKITVFNGVDWIKFIVSYNFTTGILLEIYYYCYFERKQKLSDVNLGKILEQHMFTFIKMSATFIKLNLIDLNWTFNVCIFSLFVIIYNFSHSEYFEAKSFAPLTNGVSKSKC